jgi:hypothetical protein
MMNSLIDSLVPELPVVFIINWCKHKTEVYVENECNLCIFPRW